MRRHRIVLAVSALLALACLGTFAALAPGATTSSKDIIRHGNGGENLAPFRVRVPSTMFWANSGAIFQTYTSGLDGSVNSQATKGWTYLPPGTYSIQVNAVGNWGIDVTPGVVFPKKLAGGLLRYSGNGGMTLPPFSTSHGTTLHWTSRADIFQIFSSGFDGGDVNSQASSGSTYLNAGTHSFQVNTTGAWTITWHK